MKASKLIHVLAAAMPLLAVLASGEMVLAQVGATESQQINGANGDTFMQEESPPPRRRPSSQNANSTPQTFSQSDSGAPRERIEGTSGTFMEEVTPEDQHKKKGRVPIDLSNVGVQVDKQGNIVPLRQTTPGPLQPEYNTGIQAYQEAPVPIYNGYGPAGQGTAFLPVTPGTIPGIRSQNVPYGYYPNGSRPAVIGTGPYGIGSYGISPYGISPYGISPYGYGSYLGSYSGYSLGGYNQGGYGGGYSGYGGYGVNGGYGSRPGLNIYVPQTRQYSSNYSQTSIVGPDSAMLMPLFQQGF